MTCARGYECAECGRHFGGLSGFDAHRITTTGQPDADPSYDWRCGSDAELVARRLRQDDRGFWVRPLDTPFRSTASASRRRRSAA
jgi:hypothetical protein